MQKSNRQLIKAIELIHGQVLGAIDLPVPTALPLRDWESVKQATHSVAKAQKRGWLAAARSKSRELVVRLEELRRSIDDAIWQLQAPATPHTVSTPGEIYRDLAALQDEPFELAIDLESEELCVTTEPVVLEGIGLGRFQVRLSWQRLHDDQPYRIIALEPAPAACNSSVTHPHVNDEILCEGDGRASVRRALAEGRLFDFFTMIDRLLHTYAPGRAHVELDHWEGIRCHDCGSFVDDDEYSSCDRCDERICFECSRCCPHCDRNFCSGCTDACGQCDETVCGGCLQSCSGCQSLLCPDCLTNNELCTQCHEQQTQSDDDAAELEGADAATTEPAVHADGLGQAPYAA
jgi:hypothetical protein